ncbi:uncharacterized protein ACRADG_008983 [Cochliomyia hominivorax]
MSDEVKDDDVVDDDDGNSYNFWSDEDAEDNNGVDDELSVILFEIGAKDLAHDVTTTTTPTPTATLQRSTSEGFIPQTAEGLTKRGIQITDLKAVDTIGVAAKSYDPPPEFYRGPGSTGQHYASTVTPSYYNNHNNYKPTNAFISKPIAFPDTHSSSGSSGSSGGGSSNNIKYNVAAGIQDNSDVHLANSYNTWQHLKGKVGALLNKKGPLQDRISVGHYGTSEHSNSASVGYTHDNRPYGGQAHHVDYIPNHTGYGGHIATTAHTGGYYGSTAAEAIPFDVYGSKHHYPSSGGGDYASYSYSEAHEPAVHKSHPDISQKALLDKSFLIPLASAAVLGIAAALVSNPLLLQLGTVSGVAPGAAVLGKRKRRDLTTSVLSNDKSTNNLDLALAEKDNKKDKTLLPYRAHHPQHRHRSH